MMDIDPTDMLEVVIRDEVGENQLKVRKGSNIRKMSNLHSFCISYINVN